MSYKQILSTTAVGFPCITNTNKCGIHSIINTDHNAHASPSIILRKMQFLHVIIFVFLQLKIILNIRIRFLHSDKTVLMYSFVIIILLQIVTTKSTNILL